MPPDIWEERVCFLYRGRDKDIGYRRHVIPRPVHGIRELDTVKCILERRCPTSKDKEENLADLCYVAQGVNKAGGAVRGNKVDTLAGQVMSTLCRIHHPLSGRRLPYGGGDSLQVTVMVCPQDGAHGVPHPKGGHRKIHHGREALAGQLFMEGEDPPRRGVQFDRDGEK